MRKLIKFTLLFVISMIAGIALAQNTTVTGTVTDSDNISWFSGIITFNLIGTGGSYYCSGTKMLPADISKTYNLDNTGSFSGSVCDNSNITPVNSQWQMVIQPAASAPSQTLTPTTISGVNQNLTSYISSNISAIRIPIAVNTQAYADIEIVNPPIGGIYFNLISQTQRLWSGTNWINNGSSLTPIFYFQCYGDSYCTGQGARSANGVGIWANGAFSQLAKTRPTVPSFNYGTGGANSDLITNSVWLNLQSSPISPMAFIIDGGANDGPNCGTSSACITNFKEEVSSSIGRLTIPNQERVWGSACTQTSGSWVADTTPIPIPAQIYYLNPGNAVSITTNGAVLTCTVTSRVASTKVGLNFQVTNAQTGTFTVTVDGVSQTDQCSGTTTFTSAPCAGQALLNVPTTVFRQEFTGTSGTSHTVVVTTTNAAKVNVTAIDAITPTPQTNSNYVVAFGPNVVFANSVLYDAAIGAVANQFTSDGARVVFADIQSTTNPGPGVNATTDIATTATANCDASTSVNHPNSVCGQLHLAQTIVNAARSVGWDIFGTPQAFGDGGSINGPIAIGVDANSTAPPLEIGSGANVTNWMGFSSNRVSAGFDAANGAAFLQAGAGRGIEFNQSATLVSGRFAGYTQSLVPFNTVGTAIPAAATIAPTNGAIFHITTNTTTITTITLPSGCTNGGLGCQLTLIFDIVAPLGTGGNIFAALTPTVGQAVMLTYDPGTSKWYHQ